jgi:hypothetical protein
MYALCYGRQPANCGSGVVRPKEVDNLPAAVDHLAKGERISVTMSASLGLLRGSRVMCHDTIARLSKRWSVGRRLQSICFACDARRPKAYLPPSRYPSHCVLIGTDNGPVDNNLAEGHPTHAMCSTKGEREGRDVSRSRRGFQLRRSGTMPPPPKSWGSPKKPQGSSTPGVQHRPTNGSGWPPKSAGIRGPGGDTAPTP